MRTTTLTTILAVLIAPLAAAGGIVLEVPGDAATVQGAIDVASPGDTVLVHPGTYPESIDFLGKALTLTSAGGASVTKLGDPVGGSAIRVVSTSEPIDVEISGFSFGPTTFLNAPAIDVEGRVSTVIRGCTIEGRVGVELEGHEAEPPTLLMEHCQLRDVYSGLEADDAIVTVNRCEFVRGVQRAIRASDCDLTLRNSTFRAFVLDTSFPDYGGAVFFFTNDKLDAQIAVQHCVFANNRSSFQGGALYFRGAVSALVENSTFVGNRAEGVPPAFTPQGGAIYTTSSDTTVSHCTFSDNASFRGGAIAVGLFALNNMTIDRCTFTDNNSAIAWGTVYSTRPLSMTSSIVWDNKSELVGSTITARHSNIEGGFAGDGNIDIDPLFVAPDKGVFQLQPSSPCVDTGDPLGALDPDGSPADMGATALSPWASVAYGLAGVTGTPSLSGTGTLQPMSTMELTLSHGPALDVANLVIGFDVAMLPFKDGLLVPSPDILVFGLPLDGLGELAIPAMWPTGVPSNVTTYFQAWMPDDIASKGFSASRGLTATTP